jgi:hypothetical protein
MKIYGAFSFLGFHEFLEFERHVPASHLDPDLTQAKAPRAFSRGASSFAQGYITPRPSHSRLRVPQLQFDQFIHILMCRVMQRLVHASGSQEVFHFVLGVRVEAGDIISFVFLRAVEVLVVFRFVSRHFCGSFLVQLMRRNRAESPHTSMSVGAQKWLVSRSLKKRTRL